nr:MAG TPA: hypothetical protein [Bacteriophage sp.]
MFIIIYHRDFSTVRNSTNLPLIYINRQYLIFNVHILL